MLKQIKNGRTRNKRIEIVNNRRKMKEIKKNKKRKLKTCNICYREKIYKTYKMKNIY